MSLLRPGLSSAGRCSVVRQCSYIVSGWNSLSFSVNICQLARASVCRIDGGRAEMFVFVVLTILLGALYKISIIHKPVVFTAQLVTTGLVLSSYSHRPYPNTSACVRA